MQTINQNCAVCQCRAVGVGNVRHSPRCRSSYHGTQRDGDCGVAESKGLLHLRDHRSLTDYSTAGLLRVGAVVRDHHRLDQDFVQLDATAHH